MQHVVRISDGLGNQMFQYAFAYALQRETGDEVLLDPLFWGTSLRKYDLDKFNISLDKRMVSTTLDYWLGAGPRNGRKFKNLYREYLIKHRYDLFNEKEIMSYDKEALLPQCNTYYIGFWQTAQYFDKYKNDIIKEFNRTTGISERAREYIAKIQTCNSVSVHVRRTDYVRDTGNVALSMAFYDEAIDYFKEKYADVRFFIFTDDKEYVRSKFANLNHELVEGLSDLDEFEVMKNSMHHINANSTFSWWASYLSNTNGEVVVPLVDIWNKDFYPEKWIKMNAYV